jgi:hypothetical protein
MGTVVPFKPTSTGYRLADFETLTCPTCERDVPPASISRGPTVAYRCVCGRSWRINKDGDETHVRHAVESI